MAGGEPSSGPSRSAPGKTTAITSGVSRSRSLPFSASTGEAKASAASASTTARTGARRPRREPKGQEIIDCALVRLSLIRAAGSSLTPLDATGAEGGADGTRDADRVMMSNLTSFLPCWQLAPPADAPTLGAPDGDH